MLEQDAQRLELSVLLELLHLPWAWSSTGSANRILLQAGVWISSFPFTAFFLQLCSQKLKWNKTSKPINQPKPSTFLGKGVSQLQPHSSSHQALLTLAPYQEAAFRQVLSEADLVQMVNQSSQVCWCKNNFMSMQLLG